MDKQERIARILGDWRECQSRGDATDPEEIVQAHPDLADELRARFAALNVMDQLFAEPDTHVQEPQMIGNYRLVREIGRGGMGVVYEAEQVNMERRVALKVLSVSITGTPQAVKRFQREAKAAGHLHHTNIVPVHDLDHHAGQWYYVMDLVDGQPLSEVIAQLKTLGERPSEEDLARLATHGLPGTAALCGTGTGDRAYFIRVARMFAGVAEGLELAHQEGIIHRDIKPSNLLLDADGALKIVDFGLARFDDDTLSMTVTGDLLGTPLYMSPEQAMAKRITLDHRTDIYSLGATLYELLTLQPPFEAKDLADLCSRIITKDPVLPRRASPRIPRDLETIVCKAMEKDRDKRYRTARALARDLRRFADGMAILARRISPPARAWRIMKRHKVRSSLAAAVLLLGVAGAIFGIRSAREAQRRAALEYVELCAEGYVARVQFGPEDLGHDVELAIGVHPAAVFTRAIELLPDRVEAYLGRAMLDQRTPRERLADLEEARERGLGLRSYHLARAEAFRRALDWDRVYEEERLAGDRGSATPQDLLVEGRLRFARGEHAEGERLLTQAIEASAKGFPVLFLSHRIRARLRREVGDFEGALEDLLAVRAGGDRTAATSVRIADFWRRLDHVEKGDAEFETLLSRLRSGDSSGAWFSACMASLEASRTEWLDRLSDEGLKLHPNSPGLLVARSWICAHRRDFEAAVALADRALALRPAWGPAYIARAGVPLRQRRYAEALAHLDRAAQRVQRSSAIESNRLATLNMLERHEEAYAGAERALARYPYRPEFHTQRGVALRGLGRRKEALEAYKQALELDPRHFDTHFNRGVDLEALGRRKDALAAYRRAVDLEPGSHTAHEHRACLLKQMGRFAEALAAYDRALALGPDCTPSWLDRASVLLALGKPRESLASVEHALELDSENAYAEATRAHVLRRLGREEDARAALARAVELDPENINAQVALGSELARRGQFEKALVAFELVLRLLEEDPARSEKLYLHGFPRGDPEEAQRRLLGGMRQNRGMALRGLGRLEEALKVFEDAIELAPDLAEIHYNRGLTLFALKRSKEALDAIESALELDSTDAPFHYDHGCVLRSLGRTKDALKAFERAIELDSKLVRAHVNRGGTLEALGRYAEAVKAYDGAIKIDPEFPGVHTNRGNALSALGQHKEALKAHEREIRHNPQSAAAHGNRGNALLWLKRYDDAIRAYERSIQIDPRHAIIHNNYAACLRAAGRAKDALVEFERAFDLGLPYDAELLNSWAWVSATAADLDLRDAARAVKFARAATKLAPHNGAILNTLGVALYRNGAHKESVEVLEKAMDRRDGGDANDWFFFAMVKHKLGQKDAREWYDKAVAWVDEHQRDNKELKRFRAEAEQVLGIKPK
ncbi:MAG: serine/threonine-protein kinase [Planctomycetota bacterium]|jgi:tetratricopeptide (TPR) repeat protein